METEPSKQKGWSLPLRHHIRSVFLFTASDIETVIIPQLLFAFSSTLTGGFRTSPAFIPTESLLRALAKACVWVFITLLVEDITNQRRPESVLEDSANKPWRPLPSGRLTPEAAQQWLLFIVPCAMAIGVILGAYKETVTLFVFVWMYNDIDGDKDVWCRNAVNMAGLSSFSAGVTAITSGPLDYNLDSSSVPFL
ncbi:hypothetical protein BCR34DRAFT_588596 [Clohesyomyces aquaticus]|uniref:UbiA prenyltransferase family-domain-containing protein n=1 Tax=Clohesyomyces aquaticus TaxID=1231657 RepID=A0A1Y1ZJF4_9PLEO|nr:hypothetical protein BCR34DRAFT_588596 [Clohesyomyces aquaticus]